LQLLKSGNNVRIRFVDQGATRPYIQRQREGVISDIERIVASGAGSHNLLSAGG